MKDIEVIKDHPYEALQDILIRRITEITGTLRQENSQLKDELETVKDKYLQLSKYTSNIQEELQKQIEALQQENKQLKAKLDDWKHEVQCHIDEVVAKDKELEQLRAQTAKMKEALEYLRDLLPEFGGMDGRVWLTIDEALECEYRSIGGV